MFILNFYNSLSKYFYLYRYWLPGIYFLIFTIVLLISSLLLIDTTFAQNLLDDNSNHDHQSLSTKSKPIIQVGSFPVGIDIDSISNKIYVANQFSNIISIIDPEKAKVIADIEVEDSPYGIDVNPLTNRVYVTNRGSDTVSIIDGFTNKQLTTIKVDESPLNLAVNLANNLLYVTNINSQTVTVIDTIENKVIKTLNYTSIPYDVAINPHTNLIYVSDLGNNSIQVIDGNNNTLITSIPVDSRPSVISINILSNLIYVSNFISDTVSVINGTTNKVIKQISLKSSIITTGINDPGIAVSPSVTFPFIANKMAIELSTNFVYLTSTNSNGVLVIDGNADELVTYIFIDINPPNAGEVNCNDTLKSEESTAVVVPVGKSIECKATSNRGYVFSTWSIQNNTNKNPLTFNVTGYGSLTANFKETILTETLIILVSVIIGIVSTIGGWLYRQRSKRAIKRYLAEINYIYEVLSKKHKKECITQLDKLQKEVNLSYRKGKISESQLDFLENKINSYLNKVNQQLN